MWEKRVPHFSHTWNKATEGTHFTREPGQPRKSDSLAIAIPAPSSRQARVEPITQDPSTAANTLTFQRHE